MKTIITIILALLFISSVSFAQDTLYIYIGGAVASKQAIADIDSITFYKSGSMVTDIEGNVYKTVKIGSQIWMAENLKTREFNDRTAIPLITDVEAWGSLETPGYCWYDNDSVLYNATYGVLYNWYTVETGKLCPTGWHVPADAEWTVLTDYLGGWDVAGGKLKESGLAHWIDPNEGATNETGFTALPGGYINYDGYFGSFGDYGHWWSSTEDLALSALHRGMSYLNSGVFRYAYGKQDGFSVRCLRDE